MSYAIISLGGKQYRVREGERLLVDRLATEDGKTFTPDVLLVGGDGAPQLAPTDVTVTVKVVGQQRGPKIRIGKYKKRTGYKRHTGFRASLTQIQIESIGGTEKAERAKPKQKATPERPLRPPRHRPRLPEGYEDLTVAQIKEAASRGTRTLSPLRSTTSRRTASARAPWPRSRPRPQRRRARWHTRRGSAPPERPRLREPAARREDLRRPGSQGRDDHRPPARHPLPPGRRASASAATTRSSPRATGVVEFRRSGERRSISVDELASQA